MENASLSILTTLFGGKPAGDKSSGANALFADAPDGDGKSGEGFFSFIDGLLKTSDGGGETANPLGAPSPFAVSSLTLEPAQAKAGEISIFDSPLAPAEESANALGLNGNAQALADGLVANDAPAVQNPAPVGTPGAGDALAPVTPEKSVPAAPGLEGHVSAKSGVETALAPRQGETAVQATIAKTVAPAQESAAPGQIMASAAKAANAGTGSSEDATPEAETSFETARGRSEDAPGHMPAARQPIKTPGLALNPHANAAAAIVDHASPEALSHSAVTRDEGGLEFDRLASTKLETVSTAAERAVQINPVRDQIVAAVTARHSDGRLEIRLDPPELGRVTISFDRDGAEMVRAVISADTPDTLDLMRRHADVLQRALEDQGFEGLDLHFTDQGADEKAADETQADSHLFRLAEEEAQESASVSAPQAALGRLDRRL